MWQSCGHMLILIPEGPLVSWFCRWPMTQMLASPQVLIEPVWSNYHGFQAIGHPKPWFWRCLVILTHFVGGVGTAEIQFHSLFLSPWADPVSQSNKFEAGRDVSLDSTPISSGLASEDVSLNISAKPGAQQMENQVPWPNNLTRATTMTW